MIRVLPGRLCTMTFAALVLSITCSGIAAGSAQSDYDSGLTAYKQRDYKTAAVSFQKSVSAGNKSAIVLLYLGHSYLGEGDNKNAIESYRKLADQFPTSPEAQLAISCLLKIDPTLAGKYHIAQPVAAPAASNGSAVANAPAPAKTVTFSERIFIIPATAGHPPVSPAMINTVREIVRKLPGRIYKLLDDGGANIYLAPNIEDKWPGSGDGKKPTVADGTMGEEPGRTYGREIYIYEREKVRGANTLKEARPQKENTHTCYHEMGHAIDDISGTLSAKQEFKQALQQDTSRMPDEMKTRESYFLVPMEAFAEVTGVLLGGPDEELVQNMPMVRSYIKGKLGI